MRILPVGDSIMDVLKQMSSEEQLNGYITSPVFPDGKNIASE